MDDDLTKIDKDKESALKFRERKHDDWKENYTLYRDKVIINRLTQRQTINIPLMRYGLQTVLKDIDEPPILMFKCKDNNSQKELYYNAYWNKIAEINKLPIRDRIDKKQALLFGRTFKKLNIIDGIFRFEIVDPQDMLVERHVDPADLDSARFICQTNIFRTLTWIENNKAFNKSVVNDLKNYYSKSSTTQEAQRNYQSYAEKQERMSDMGLTDAFNPLVGETYVELNDILKLEYNEKTDQDEFIFYTLASTDNGLFKLYKKPLSEHIGKTSDDFWVNHVPYTSWGVDVDRTDFWSDGVADVVRQPNKVLNSWISQLVENRTLKNFNMHYYDSTKPDFVPQTFTPVDWGWYPTPGDPNVFIKDVAVPDLSDSLDEIQFVISVAEKAIAASGSQSGQVEQRQVTLGEVEMAMSNAKERTKSSQVFYQEDWKSFGTKYTRMLESRFDDLQSIDISKKGKNSSRLYTKEISPEMFDSKQGYEVEVTIKEDRDVEMQDNLQKLNAAKTIMFDNAPLQSIYKKKLLDFAGLNADEQKEVMDFENQKAMMPINPMMPMQQPAPVPPVAQTL